MTLIGENERDALSLDQLAVFVAVVEAGSFSAAARKLKRAQSAVTYGIQNLEAQTRSALFDRSGYRPVLTAAGRALLPRARRILDDVSDFRRQARTLSAGLEARLTLAVDVVVPPRLLTAALGDFNRTFPMVEIALLVHPMDATLAILQSGEADLGVIVDVAARESLEGLERLPCGGMGVVLVAAPGHPLAQSQTPLRKEDLQNHTQLLLSSGGDATGANDWGAHAINRWRVNDLNLRHHLLRAGVGWSSMPRHVVEADMANGKLVALNLDSQATAARLPEFSLCVAHLRKKALGPAGTWLRDRLAVQSEGSGLPL